MNKKTLFLSFSAPINQNTAETLMATFSQKLNEGITDFYFLISSPGGSVTNGVTVYNFLKSLPINLTTHNIGIVDSIANIIFLAGRVRYSVRNSSFLFHGVGFDVNQPTRFEEKNLKERLLSIQRDQKLIANIIAQNTKLSVPEVENLFLEADTMTPEQAKAKEIIHDIIDVSIPDGSQVVQLVFQMR